MEPTDENLRAWSERYRADATDVIPQAVRDRLPPLEGLRVLQLECGEGAVARALAAGGALVTGADASADALATAREAAPALPWVHADPARLPAELLRARFDLVYLDRGGLAAVGDLEAWATGVHGALRPLGWLVVHDAHPVAPLVDGSLRWRGDYFAGGVRLGALVTAVAQAGLTVRRLEEYPARRAGAHGQDPRVPGKFRLGAEKPQ